MNLSYNLVTVDDLDASAGDYRLRLVPAEARHDRITQESTAASS